MAKKITYRPANGKTFKIVMESGKAPYKLLFLDADGSEFRRTHHKSEKLACDRAHLYNPNMPIVK